MRPRHSGSCSARGGTTGPASAQPPPVHPRAGGEHRYRRPSAVHPRAGGEPGDVGGSCPTPSTPVHPRAGGEHRVPRTAFAPFSHFGSSPRRRGTPTNDVEPWRISATVHPRAGGEHDLATSRATTVHPRAGGEHNVDAVTSPTFTAGSSPRRRGTPGRRRSPSDVERFIPAQAGNIPVAGGEHGSSPRRRGTHREGLIRYGSSPRRRGTPVQRANRHEQSGSSPRRRGTRRS